MDPITIPEISTPETLARRFYDVLNTGDLGLLDRTLAPDWAERPPAPGQGPGRDGYKPVVEAFRLALPDVHFTTEDLFVAADKVVVRSVVQGTHRGPLLGVPATGRPVTFRTIDIHRVADGLIVESWHIEDFFSLYQQMTVRE